jgi:hypothetical protein
MGAWLIAKTEDECVFVCVCVCVYAEDQCIVVLSQITVVISIANKKGNAGQLNATNEVREQMEKTGIKNHIRKDRDSLPKLTLKAASSWLHHPVSE